jgi:tetratricopeptide (TPR) repeat protein
MAVAGAEDLVTMSDKGERPSSNDNCSRYQPAPRSVIDKGAEEPEAREQGTPHGLQQEGNDLFKLRKYAEAGGCYSRALDLLKETSGADAGKVRKACMLNRAACFLEQGMFKDVVQDCTALLNKDPTSVKALFRRAKAQSAMRTDILSVSNAAQDLRLALMIAPNDRQILKLKEQVEHDLPLLEQRLLDLQFHDAPFWQVGDSVMVGQKAHKKLGGRGSLQLGEVGTVLDVDVKMQAGGRVKVQGPRSTYWYDMEELQGAVEGHEEVDVVTEPGGDDAQNSDSVTATGVAAAAAATAAAGRKQRAAELSTQRKRPAATISVDQRLHGEEQGELGSPVSDPARAPQAQMPIGLTGVDQDKSCPTDSELAIDDLLEELARDIASSQGLIGP